MDVFKELTGIDLMDVQEKEMKKRDNAADLAKERAVEAKARKEAEDKAQGAHC